MATSRHTHNFRKCSHASMGLAQARPNELQAVGLFLAFDGTSTRTDPFTSVEKYGPNQCKKDAVPLGHSELIVCLNYNMTTRMLGRSVGPFSA